MKTLSKIEILQTSNGFMVYDNDCDEYLYDINGDNCFDIYQDAATLKFDLEKTREAYAND
jgi:hypothetical protein